MGGFGKATCKRYFMISKRMCNITGREEEALTYYMKKSHVKEQEGERGVIFLRHITKVRSGSGERDFHLGKSKDLKFNEQTFEAMVDNQNLGIEIHSTTANLFLIAANEEERNMWIYGLNAICCLECEQFITWSRQFGREPKPSKFMILLRNSQTNSDSGTKKSNRIVKSSSAETHRVNNSDVGSRFKGEDARIRNRRSRRHHEESDSDSDDYNARTRKDKTREVRSRPHRTSEDSESGEYDDRRSKKSNHRESRDSARKELSSERQYDSGKDSDEGHSTRRGRDSARKQQNSRRQRSSKEGRTARSDRRRPRGSRRKKDTRNLKNDDSEEDHQNFDDDNDEDQGYNLQNDVERVRNRAKERDGKRRHEKLRQKTRKQDGNDNEKRKKNTPSDNRRRKSTADVSHFMDKISHNFSSTDDDDFDEYKKSESDEDSNKNNEDGSFDGDVQTFKINLNNSLSSDDGFTRSIMNRRSPKKITKPTSGKEAYNQYFQDRGKPQKRSPVHIKKNLDPSVLLDDSGEDDLPLGKWRQKRQGVMR